MQRSSNQAWAIDATPATLQVIATLYAAIAVGVWTMVRTADLWLGSSQSTVVAWAQLAGAGQIQAFPEPIERAAFVLLASIAPVVSLLVFAFASRQHGPLTLVRSDAPVGAWLLPVAAAGALAYPFRGAEPELLNSLFFHGAWARAVRLPLLMVGVATCAAALWLVTRRSPHGRQRTLVFVILAATAALLLQVIPVRLKSFESVTSTPAWAISYDAAIYAASQVAAGKTLLADLPSQYGLFPELVAPVLRLFGGFSVQSFSFLMATLQLGSFVALAFLLSKYVRSRLIAALAFAVILVTGGLVLYLDGIADEIYLQYFPIRFFWPALTLAIFGLTERRRGRWPMVGLGITAGIAAFWNMDTGIPAIVAVGATLFSRSVLRRGERWDQVAAFALTAASTIIACTLMLQIKADKPLQLAEALLYQKIFYGSGFGMLPMPLPLHPWQAVLALYLAGMVTALAAWSRGARASRYDLLFCASLLGVGLFAYYQGRSHFYNLVGVSWPAWLVGAILLDLLARLVRAGRTRPWSLIAVAPVAFFFVQMSTGLAVAVPDLLIRAATTISEWGTIRDPIVASEGAFIRSTVAGRSCLILAQRQGIYYAESGTASPLPGPGLIETLLQRDVLALRERIGTGRLACIYLGQGENSAPMIDVGTREIMEKYEIRAHSRDSTLLLLEPRRP